MTTGSTLPVVVNLFAAGFAVSPEGPQRSGLTRRTPWRSRRTTIPDVSRGLSAEHPGRPRRGSDRPASSADALRRTTRLSNTHGTDERRILYEFHPWSGQEVAIDRAFVKGGVPVAHCRLAGSASPARSAVVDVRPAGLFGRPRAGAAACRYCGARSAGGYVVHGRWRCRLALQRPRSRSRPCTLPTRSPSSWICSVLRTTTDFPTRRGGAVCRTGRGGGRRF